VKTAPWLLLLALAAPLAADEGVTTERLLELFGEGKPLNLQLAFDQDSMTHDLDINTASAAAGVVTVNGRTTVSFSTAVFARDGVEHCFRVRVTDGALEAVELLVRAAAPDGDPARAEWRPVAPEVFLFAPRDPPQRAAEVDDEGRVILSLWGTCNLAPGAARRGRALVVVRSGHVEGAGEARY
jgi:hypothetical protein